MSIIKPGKLGVGAPARSESKSKTSNTRAREVWDDYSSNKGNKQKKEYQRGSGNRMVPKSKPRKGDLNFKNDPELEASEEEVEEQDTRTDYIELEEKLQISFKDTTLLSRALTHRSALNLRDRADYERLEFLGDAVLDLSVAHLLSDLHPEAREGELSKMRAALVNTQALAEIAKKLELGPYIRLGRGELSSGGAERPSILADVMEAVIGAVYRDNSYEVALEMIERIFGSLLHEVTPFDPKTELQEALHAAGSEPPSYLLELVEGPEHAPTFVTVVVIDGEIAGRGRGTTKKSAQQEAAAEALLRMVWEVLPLDLREEQEFFLEDCLLCAPPPQEKTAVSDEAAEGHVL